MPRTRWQPVVVLMAVLIAACGGAERGTTRVAVEPSLAPERPSGSPGEESPGEPIPAPSAEVAEPVTVRIPAIEVDATLVGLGLQDDGAMEMPDFGFAGWYIEGPKPGESGPAVIASHVDSGAEGPDEFRRLSELVTGDGITVIDHDGRDYTFIVERVEQHDQDALPVEAIWGPTDGPTLRLISFGGEFDDSVGRYADNIIVYATAE